MNYTLMTLVVLLALLTAPAPAHAPIKGGAIAVLICDPGPGTVGAPLAADRP